MFLSMASNNTPHNTILRYLIVGAISFCVDYFSLLILYRLFHLPLVVGTTISFFAGLIVNFSFHKYWTFDAENGIRKSTRQAMLYGLLVVVNLIFTNWFIIILAKKFNLGPEITKPITTLIIMTWNYLAYKKIIFKSVK